MMTQEVGIKNNKLVQLLFTVYKDENCVTVT